ncbi:MAG TPA: O-antigen ligase family protein [Vicinamibacterales bacterium]|nr:O-antigen ligase family protein [Vicinamibacterales bacterium]
MQRTLLLLLVAASYVLLAGGRNWTLGPLLVIAAAAALAAPRRTFLFSGPTRLLDLSLIAILGVIALQLVPLPAPIVDLLSPHAATVKGTIRFSPLAGGESWTTLTVNPRATAIALATALLGVLSFWTARAVFNAGGSTRIVCRALTFFGTLVALLAVIQRAIAPRTVLFIIEPEARSASPFGAFVNRNHFAAWLLLMIGPVAGYGIARLHMRPVATHWRQSIGQVMSSGAVFTAIGVFAQVGVLLLTLSRSALAGLAAAAATASAMGRQRMRFEQIRVPTVLGAGAVLLLMVVLFVDIEGWAQRFGDGVGDGAAGLDRMTIWRESAALIRDFWLTGAGAGAFGDAMVTYQQSRVWVGSMQRWAHINNAHSHYVQVAAEGGLLLALPVLAALTLTVTLGLRAVRADKGEMFWVRVGAAAAFAALVVQSIWEIALVMPANAVLAGVVAALWLYRREPTRC